MNANSYPHDPRDPIIQRHARILGITEPIRVPVCWCGSPHAQANHPRRELRLNGMTRDEFIAGGGGSR